MDQVVVGERAIVAACAFVPAGMHIPEQTLVAGLPAKIKRVLTDEEVGWKQDGTRAYHALTRRSLSSMQMVEPLTQIEVNRPQLDVAAIQPLVTIKQRRS